MQLVDINIGLHGFKVGEMIQLGQKLKIQRTAPWSCMCGVKGEFFGGGIF